MEARSQDPVIPFRSAVQWEPADRVGVKMSPTDTVAFESSEPLKVTPVESAVSRQQICMWSVVFAQSRVSSDTAENYVHGTRRD